MKNSHILASLGGACGNHEDVAMEMGSDRPAFEPALVRATSKGPLEKMRAKLDATITFMGYDDKLLLFCNVFRNVMSD